MSGTLTGRAPRTDPEWARDVTQRLRRLESATSVRVGQWSLTERAGALIASKPGEITEIGRPVEATLVDLTNYATKADISELAKTLNAGLSIDPATMQGVDPLTQITRWAQQIGQQVAGAIQLNPLVQAITGFTGGLTELADWANLVPRLIGTGSTLLSSWVPGLDASKIISGVFPASLLDLSNLAASAVSGVLSAANIPGLDVSKIVSGVFGTGFIPNLPAGQITSGTFLTSLIPGLDASKIISGVLSGSAIPNLPASIITTGTLAAGLIPNLNASIITTGTLATSTIPGLDAGKIISGVLSGSLIPNLAASIINSGTFSAAQIPGLDVSKIISGVFGTGLIPNLPTSKITSGTFLSSFFPAFTLQQAAGSNLLIDPGFENPAQWTYAQTITGVTISTTRAHSGTRSMKITGPTALYMGMGNDGGGITPVKTRPGEKFRIGAWIWPEAANAGTGQLLFDLNTVGADGSTFTANTAGANLATLTKGQWNYVEQVLTVDPAGYYFYPLIWTPAVPATDVYYVDDALVREETAPQSIIQQLFGGTSVLSSVLSSVVPGLDASKIISGVLSGGIIPNITTAMSTDMQSTVDQLVNAFTGGVYGITVAPTYGATGAGSGWLGGASSWAHTLLATDKAIVVIAAWSGGAAPTFSIAGQSIPALAGSPYVVAGGVTLGIYGLMNPPTGPQTVSANATASSAPCANSVSYGGVSSFGTPQFTTGTGTALAQTATALTSDLVVNGFTDQVSNMSAYNRNQRYLNNIVGGVHWGLLMGDASIGAASVPFTATGSASQVWSGVALPLHGIAPHATPSSIAAALAAIPGSFITGALNAAVTLSGKAVSTLFDASGLIASQISGILAAGAIPGLDASKIISGVLSGSLIPNLNASIINAGTFAAGLIPGLDVSKIVSGVFGTGFIPSLPASQITSGTFTTGLIPGLDLSKITSGFGTGIATWLGVGGALPSTTTLATTGLTGLATNIGTWLTGGGALPSATTLQGSQLLGSVASSLLSGTLSTSIIPGLDLSKITSGLATGVATWLGAGGNLPSATTVAGQLVTDIQTNLAAATTAATSAGAPDLAAVVTRAQQSIDQQIAAFSGAALAAGQTAVQLGATATAAFAQWTNALKGTAYSSATAPDVTAALQQQVAQQLSQATLTQAIQAQLPKFYGGSGTAGANFNISLAGLTSLPAGWTDISCALCAKVAKYNTAATTNSQTVSAIWSTSDYLPKFIILRANSTFTDLVYAKVQSNNPTTGAANCEIGYLVSGVKTVIGATFALPGGTSGIQQANQAYTFQATASDFTLSGPGGLSVTRTSATPAADASHRYGGFGNDGVINSTQTLTTAGNFNIPGTFTTGDKFNVALFGGYGGGGGGGAGVAFGGAGGWGGIGGWGNAQAFSWTYGTDFPTSTTTMAFTPGGGGGGGAGATTQGATGSPGSGGGTSSLAVTGLTGSPKTATGGTAGGGGGGGGFPSNGLNGGNGSPGSTQYATTNNGIWSTTPANGYGGPGGPGAAGGFAGGNGGNGYGGSGTVDFISTHTNVGTMNNWVFYDSGPAAGPASTPIATSETTTSSTYADLATTTDSVTVVIGNNGCAWVDLTSYMSSNTAGGQAYVSVALSGANTVAASDANAIYKNFAVSNGESLGRFNAAWLWPGLNPGATTFKMKYKTGGTGTATFKDRRVGVTPL